MIKLLNKITRTCLTVAWRAAASHRAPAKPALTDARPSPQPVVGPSLHTVAQLSAEAHWARVSAVVERSVERAQDIGAQQSAARQQLDAAEYTLHRLIEELNEVMMSPVQLPKRADRAAAVQAPAFVEAMAA